MSESQVWRWFTPYCTQRALDSIKRVDDSISVSARRDRQYFTACLKARTQLTIRTLDYLVQI